MKICIAQTKSLKGKVQENIQNHLRMVESAIQINSDLIIFPELSITNYESDLAKKLATDIKNSIFTPFQELSDKNEITIGIGMPTKTTSGIQISMLIFQPKVKSIVYSKQILHSDELPYFVCGNKQTILTIKKKKIALGICYETLQREHFLNASQNNIDFYIASVAKSKDGVEKAYKHFSKTAKEFKTPVLMSNCIGFCDNFMSAGQSAIWNKHGVLIEHLNSKDQGILIYDTELKTTEINQLKITKGQLGDLKEIFQIYLNGKNNLEKSKIYQWTATYPTISIIENDLRKHLLYTLKNNTEIIGAIHISEEQESEYELIPWEFDPTKVLVIHRLIIEPKHQRNGYAKKLMDYAENYAKENNYTSIRLDAYSKNKSVVEFYKKRNYCIRGNVHFPEREYPFYCMEKEIIAIKSKQFLILL